MKIRIDNQIFETDENTLCDWIRLGRIPEDAELSCETLTNGKWRAIHELDLEVDANPPLLEEKLEQTKKSPSHRRKLPKVTLVLIAINAIAFILLDQGRGYSKDPQLLTQFGAYSYSLIVEAGEYWRLIANTFLHAGLRHFGLNMVAILVLGYLVERLFGQWRYLIIYLVAAIGGSLASLLFIHISIGAGASGAFFGLAGALVAFGLRYRKQLSREQRRECRIILICIGIDIFVMPFFMRDINTVAHVGGVICGAIVGLLLPPANYSDHERERKTVIAFASALVALTMLSGGLAVSNFFLNSAEAVEERIATAVPPHDAAELPSYIERYEELLRKRGYDSGYYYHLALLYMQMMENEPENPFWVSKLKKLYKHGLLMAPQQPAWHEGLRSLYSQTAFKQPDEQKQVKSYIDIYNKVIRRHGYHRILYQNQEYFYLRATELAPQHKAPWERKLEQLYSKAASADQDYTTWPNNLAWLYVQQKKKPRKAVKLAQRAVELEPQSPVLLDTLGWAYVRDKQYIKALRVFELVLGAPERRLFDIPLEFQTDLDNNHFSKDLRTAFGNYGLILPPNAEITIDTENGKWIITIINGANEVTLVVKREQNGLNVYPIKSETILTAQESSWDGMTELLQSDIDPLALEEFSQAFFRFYNRMSRQLVAGSSTQARLEALFNLFQLNHAQPLKE